MNNNHSNLNTGIINGANGNSTATFVFDSELTNKPGPDIFFFEIASNFDPDQIALLINGQTGSIAGASAGSASGTGDWGALGVTTSSSDIFARSAGAPATIDDLENDAFSRTSTAITQGLYGVGIDLSDYGVADGGTATSIQYGSAAGGQGTADPVMIVAASVNLSDPEVQPVAGLDFGGLALSALPASLLLTVENIGATQNLTISNATITGTDAALFSIVSSPVAIAPGSTGDFEIAFDSAGALGTFSAALEFETNDPDEAQLSAALTAATFPGDVTSVATSSSDLFEILDDVTTVSQGVVASAHLVKVTPFSFRSDGGNLSNLIQPGGSAALPDPRQSVLEDFALNNGIINPGTNTTVTTGTVIDDSVVGVGVRFNEPVVNRDGTDAVFFELSVGETQGPDAVAIALLDETDTVIGDLVIFQAPQYTLSANQMDATVVDVSPASTSLAELNANAAANGNVVDAYYNLLELEFSQFGLASGATVHGVYVRGSAVDPTLIAGLPDFLGDPDLDGLSNLEELAYGTDPDVADNAFLTVDEGAGTFTPGTAITDIAFSPLTFSVRFVRLIDFAAQGLTYTVQFSSDLENWEDSTEVPAVGVQDAASGYEVVEIPYMIFLGNGQKAEFFRIVVTAS